MSSRVQPWKIRSSKRVLCDRWISVRADDCVTAEGVEVSPYYVLETADWVNVVALDAADNVLLVRQYRHGLGRISLELPAGCIDAGEPVLEAAARELAEETGYGKARELTLVSSLSPNTASHCNLIHTVLATQVLAIGEPCYDAVEVLEVERVPYREALNLAFSGAIMQSTHVASLVLGLGAAKKISL
ncbi:MAG: NUDIX hydrolase [Rhodomicrobium sp.]